MNQSQTVPTTAQNLRPPQGIILGAVILGFLVILAYLVDQNAKNAFLFVVGGVMGLALFHGSYGFSGAYKHLLINRDMTGVVAQLIMLAIAIVLFAPFLARGEIFGHGVNGSIAPVSVSVVAGAFVFGIGMQFARGCASGTLYTAGAGNMRMALVLLFFCIGSFWGSLDLGWWQRLPSFGSISLGHLWGWKISTAVQLTVLGALYIGLKRAGWTLHVEKLWGTGFTKQNLLRGPWPLLFSAGALAVLNWIVLLTTGHGWSITWAFSLWGAKGAALLGWNPLSSPFWASGFQYSALSNSVLNDTTSVMDIGIILGAFIAAALAGRYAKSGPTHPNPYVFAIIGGVLLGYGARLSYGCNIGAFFSGVASGSLHGWAWILFALPGNAVGIFIRRRLEKE